MSVGILGGGQLGLMLAESLDRLGASCWLYDPDPVAPAAIRWPERTITAGWDDLGALTNFFSKCRVITYESENVLTAPFHALGVNDRVIPSIGVLETVQDRIREKTFLSRHELPHVAFRALKDIADLPKVAEDFGYPFIVKSARGGYDGKGQYRIENAAALQTLPPLQAGVAGWWVIEEIIDIDMEVSCIVGRTVDGHEVSFPLFENVHRNHILDFTTTPARIPEHVGQAIHDVATQAAQIMGVTGLLTVEFFLTKAAGHKGTMAKIDDWYFGVNEFAPRPHNSGHVTRAATQISQFDALAHILTETPLPTPQFVDDRRYCMGQLLGEVWIAQGGATPLDTTACEGDPSVVEIYDYEKAAIRPKRKMGHYIVHGESIEQALAHAESIRNTLSRTVQQ